MATLPHPTIDWTTPTNFPQAPADIVLATDNIPGTGITITNQAVEVFPVQSNAAVDLSELTVGYPT